MDIQGGVAELLVAEPEYRPWVGVLIAAITDTELNVAAPDCQSFCAYFHVPTGPIDIIAVDCLLKSMARRISATTKIASYLVYFHEALHFPLINGLASIAIESPSVAVRTATALLKNAETASEFLEDPDSILRWIFFQSGSSWQSMNTIYQTMLRHLRHAAELPETGFWIDTILTRMELLSGERLDATIKLGAIITTWVSTPDLMHRQLYDLISHVMHNLGQGAVRLFLDRIQYDQRISLDPRLVLPENNQFLLSMAPLNTDSVLELPFGHEITFIDTIEALYFAFSILSKADAIGVDTETKPQWKKGGSRNLVAILQVSCKHYSFIFDLLYFGYRSDDRSIMFSMLSCLLRSSSILKIGMQFEGDLRDLHSDYPDRDTFLSCSPYIEVTDMFHSIFEGSQLPSLQKLVRYCTGRRMSKANRTTDWSQRPLTNRQLIYAALDAEVLIHVAQSLFEQCEGRLGEYPLSQSRAIKIISGIRPVKVAVDSELNQ